MRMRRKTDRSGRSDGRTETQLRQRFRVIVKYPIIVIEVNDKVGGLEFM